MVKLFGDKRSRRRRDNWEEVEMKRSKKATRKEKTYSLTSVVRRTSTTY